jgi:hypothetical protein
VDFDGDIDVDGGVDMDVDADVDSGSFLKGILQFFNVGEIPIMAVFSIFILSLWAIAINLNHFLNPESYLLPAMGLLIPNILISSIITKVCNYPLRKLFNALNRQDSLDQSSIIGETCIVTTSEVNTTSGQAEIRRDGGPPIVINARTECENPILQEGDPAVVLEELKNNTYIIY